MAKKPTMKATFSPAVPTPPDNRTAFFFNAIAGGMRDEDVARAIELADYCSNPFEVSNPFLCVFFSPKRLALTPSGTLYHSTKPLPLNIATGHVFCAEWRAVMRYKDNKFIRVWDRAAGFLADALEVTYEQ